MPTHSEKIEAVIAQLRAHPNNLFRDLYAKTVLAPRGLAPQGVMP